MGEAEKSNRFNQLRGHIEDMWRIQHFKIAQLAINNPDNLSGNPRFQACVQKFTILEAILEKADGIEMEEVG